MDLTFKTKEGKFNYRVGAIIIKDSKVLVVKNSKASYYYSVGGRVKFNETTQDAVLREVREELGINMEIDRPLVFHENFFNEELDNIYFHEVAVYYLMKSTDELDKIVCKSYTDKGDKEELCWLPIDDLKNYKIFPEFYYSLIKELPKSPKFLTQIKCK